MPSKPSLSLACLFAVAWPAITRADPPAKPVLTLRGDAEAMIAPDEAARAGLTRVSLRDDWTPYIFQEPLGEGGVRLLNRYRATFLGLAQDRSDEDGQPLAAGARNYLELYGIPPTLSVLRERFLDDARPDHPCAALDLTKIASQKTIPTYDGSTSAARKKQRLSGAALAAFLEVEKRLRCEGLLPPKARHTSGFFDEAMREALIRFQRKNKLYDVPAFREATVAALGRPLLDNDYDALVRTLTERVVEAGNLLEDGSVEKLAGKAGPPSYEGEGGQQVPIPSTVEPAVAATLEQLGLRSAADALAFFRRHPAEDFQWLEAGVKLAAPPPYHSAQMELSVEIDRGDVIYDPLYKDDGKATDQSRHRYPMLTLRTVWKGKSIPLVHWRTTIGGWRSDLAPNGYEYFRYKGSDVGPRIWRNIVAGPVWNAPPSTPLRSLVKDKAVNGSSQMVVNYDEIGPGYLSAYGLVAAYNVEPGRNGKPDGDNGVRVHGSSEYLSIRNPNAYSHGCHRLMNHLAVRLFSFVLRHRNVKILGERPLGFSRQFLWNDSVFEIRLPTRGFHYELDPPVAVNVLEGNIRGKARKPILTYKPKPGVVYPPGPPPLPPDLPEARAGGGG